MIHIYYKSGREDKLEGADQSAFDLIASMYSRYLEGKTRNRSLVVASYLVLDMSSVESIKYDPVKYLSSGFYGEDVL